MKTIRVGTIEGDAIAVLNGYSRAKPIASLKRTFIDIYNKLNGKEFVFVNDICRLELSNGMLRLWYIKACATRYRQKSLL